MNNTFWRQLRDVVRYSLLSLWKAAVALTVGRSHANSLSVRQSGSRWEVGYYDSDSVWRAESSHDWQEEAEEAIRTRGLLFGYVVFWLFALGVLASVSLGLLYLLTR